MEINNLQIKQTLGIAYENHKKGNLELAKSLYEKILKMDSNNFEAIFLLGTLFLQKKNLQEAIRFLNKCILIKPKDANSYQNLGYAFVELGEFERAEELFFKAIEIEPNHGDAHFNLANTYKQMRNFKKAQEFYEKTIQIQPNNPSVYNNYANVCKQVGEFSKAITSYNKAIELKPDHPRAHHNLGNTYNQLGEFPKAINSFKRAYQYQPFNLESLYNWSDLDEGILDLKLKKKINLIMKSQQLPKKDSAYGNFLLSKYEQKDKNYKREFDYLLKGHKHYFESEEKKHKKQVEHWLTELPNVKGLFDFNKRKKNIKKTNQILKPIFIVGVPRCGSTLVEKIIASGSKYIPTGEETGVISTFVKRRLIKNQSLNFVTTEVQTKLFEIYKQKRLIHKENDFTFTDKTLDNFFYIGMIKEIFPHAKVINCKRSTISSIMSIIKNNLPAVPWAHNLEHIFKYFDIYYRMIKNFKKSFPNFIYELEFEKLVNDPENVSKKLMKFCGLPWDVKCLEFYKRKDLISQTSSNLQIRKAIYKHSEKKYLPYKQFLKKYGDKYAWYN